MLYSTASICDHIQHVFRKPYLVYNVPSTPSYGVFFFPAALPTIRLLADPSRFSSLLISAQHSRARLISIRDARLEGSHTVFKGYPGSTLASQEHEFYLSGLKPNVEIYCRVSALNQTRPANTNPLSNLCMC